jgi:putative intracellular protease/amidase
MEEEAMKSLTMNRSFARALSTLVMLSAAAIAGCADDPAVDPATPGDTSIRALLVVSNVGTMPAGESEKETGVWFSEVTHPYWALRGAAGVHFTLDLASPDGGRAPIDTFSVKLNLDDYLASGGAVYDSGDPDNERFLGDPETRARVAAEDVEMTTDTGETITVTRWSFVDTLPLAEVRADDYDVVYYAGGNGASFQFPEDAETGRVAAEMYGAGKLVTAACHGTSALLNATTADGGYLVAGRDVTGFSNAEEDQLGQRDVMPVLLEDEFPKRGARYAAAPAWAEHVIVDGRIITGQNPTSARGVGEEIVTYFTP